VPETSPYGVTQNADSARVTANQLVGTSLGLTTADGITGSAAMFSTAPYVPPRHGCRGKKGTCQAAPLRGTDLCIFHTPRDQGEPPTAP
jgi:hypothetical protein